MVLAAAASGVIHIRAGEPDEVGEVGKVTVQPVDLGGIRAQLARDIKHPARGPLEEVELAHLIRQFSRELITGEPLPMTATRFPVRSRSDGHRAVWKERP